MNFFRFCVKNKTNSSFLLNIWITGVWISKIIFICSWGIFRWVLGHSFLPYSPTLKNWSELKDCEGFFFRKTDEKKALQEDHCSAPHNWDAEYIFPSFSNFSLCHCIPIYCLLSLISRSATALQFIVFLWF